MLEVKTSLFDLPKLLKNSDQKKDHFFGKNFDSFYLPKNQKSLSFTEFAKKRDNFEFMKEFNQLNDC